MAKVTINGEVFGFDPTRKPMYEALAIENALKCTYAQWETDMGAGSARALCGFIWMIWHRDGRDVSLEDILNGTVDVDLASLAIEAEPGEETPTSPPPVPSPGTGGGTSERSARSGSGPGKSASSNRTSSTP